MASDKADKEKAKRVEQLSDSIGDLRDQVKEDLDSDDMREQLTALAVAVMDETYARPGNRQSVKERGNYGITQLECRHFSFSGNKVTIEYTGKKGVDQKKQFDNAKLKKLLKERCDDVGKNTCIFCFEDSNGNHRRVDAGDVNTYLRDFDVTAKDLRGFHANNLMREKVKEIRKDNGNLPDDGDEKEKQLKDEFKEALEEVAEMLGHEPSTLRGSYLVPHFEDDFLEDAEPPKKFSKSSFIANRVANRVARERGILPLTRGSANTDRRVESAWGPYQKTSRNWVFGASNIQKRLMQEYEGLNLWVREIDDTLVVLSKITLPEEKRGSGLGSRIMDKLTRWADRKGVTIATTPSGDFGGDVNRLESFYRKFGFVKNSGVNKVWKTSETMVRPPNPSKTSFHNG